MALSRFEYASLFEPTALMACIQKLIVSRLETQTLV